MGADPLSLPTPRVEQDPKNEEEYLKVYQQLTPRQVADAKSALQAIGVKEPTARDVVKCSRR